MSDQPDPISSEGIAERNGPIDKDPWCCASDKLRINIDGFDAGYINALKSARHMVHALSKADALAVLDELIADYTPQRQREASA